MGGYLSELREVRDLLIWCWQEFIHEDSKKIARIMLFIQVAAGIVNMVRVWSISIVFNALTIPAFGPAFIELCKGLFLFWFFGTVASYMNLKVAEKREKLFAVNTGYMEQKVMNMFLTHSLSMHISEDTNLNEATVRKGNEYLSKIQWIFLFQGFEAILALLLPFGAIAVLSYVTGSIMMFVAPALLFLIYIVSSFYLARSVVKDAGPIDEDWKAYNRYRIERFREPERIKNNAKEEYELNQVTERYDKVAKVNLDYWCWYILRAMDRNALSEYYVNFALVLGSFHVLFGKMSLGLLSPVYSWSWRIVEGLWRLADVEMQINKAVPSVMSLKRALTLPVGIYLPKNPIVLPKGIPLRIEFKNVSYKYENKKTGTSVPVLKDVSFVIEPGEKVALIGPSGAGKTTIVRLLLRYMDPTSGVILVNGIDLKEIDLNSWLSRTGYVRQQAEMLSGDIRYNLCYSLDDCGESLTDDDVSLLQRKMEPKCLTIPTKREP